MSIHICHAYVYRHPIYYYYSTMGFLNCQVWDAVVTLSEGQGHQAGKDYVDLQSDYLHSELDGHCLNRFWNNGTFIIFMKVKVNIINTCCILMTEAVTVSNLIAISLHWFEWNYMPGNGQTDTCIHRQYILATDRQTHVYTDSLA